MLGKKGHGFGVHAKGVEAASGAEQGPTPGFHGVRDGGLRSRSGHMLRAVAWQSNLLPDRDHPVEATAWAHAMGAITETGGKGVK